MLTVVNGLRVAIFTVVAQVRDVGVNTVTVATQLRCERSETHCWCNSRAISPFPPCLSPFLVPCPLEQFLPTSQYLLCILGVDTL